MLLNWLSNPINSNSVGSGNISHWRPPSLSDHLDHCFLAFKHIPQNFLMRRQDVWRNKVNIIQNVEHSSRLPLHVICITANNGFSRSIMVLSCVSKTKTIRYNKSRAGIPSFLNPAFKEMISDSVELCETAVCFSHIQLLGTNVWLPKTHNVPPEVDFERSISPAKSESGNSPRLHCLTVLKHGNTVCIHTNDECKRSEDINVCQHKLLSILWSIDHTISSRSSNTCQKYKHFRTIWHVAIQITLKSMSMSSRCVNKPMDCPLTSLPVLRFVISQPHKTPLPIAWVSEMDGCSL